MKNIIILLILFGITACSSLEPAQKLNPKVYYRHDICFTFETGKIKKEKIRNFFKRFRSGRYRRTKTVKEKATFCGAGVLPYLDEYNLTINTHSKLDFFAMTTCHEETTTESPDKGIFKKNGIVHIKYVPTMERGKACPLYLSAYNRKQKHGWGIAVFEDPRYKLPATVYCNGHVNTYNGVSVCQSRVGLLQKIEFNEPVKLVTPVNGAAERKKACPVLGSDFKTSYEFKLPPRECFYGFIGKNSNKIHKLLTVGYEDIIVRGE